EDTTVTISSHAPQTSAGDDTKHRGRRTIRFTALIAAFALFVLTACGGAEAADKTQGVALANAEFLEDPKDHVGPSTAYLADSAIRPIAQNPEPQMPATVTDSQGTTVTVTDVSRILALDL